MTKNNRKLIFLCLNTTTMITLFTERMWFLMDFVMYNITPDIKNYAHHWIINDPLFRYFFINVIKHMWPHFTTMQENMLFWFNSAWHYDIMQQLLLLNIECMFLSWQEVQLTARRRIYDVFCAPSWFIGSGGGWLALSSEQQWVLWVVVFMASVPSNTIRKTAFLQPPSWLLQRQCHHHGTVWHRGKYLYHQWPNATACTHESLMLRGCLEIF